jgi:hypothetical protein
LRQLPTDPTNEDVAAAIDATINQYPALIDYYIRYKEEHQDEAKRTSRNKVAYSERLFLNQAARLASLLSTETGFYEVSGGTYSECLQRVEFMKHVIEDRGGFRLFYSGGRPIEREQDVHVMFDLVWLGSPSDINREVNNGRGPADFTVSRGSTDKTVVEFKLAGNSQIKRNLAKQTEIYKKGGRAHATVKVVVFFNEQQEARVRRILRELEMETAQNVVLIDARADNKPSASKA